MKVYYCLNSPVNRGAAQTDGKLGKNRQLVIAPEAVSWYGLVLEEPGGNFYLLSSFEQKEPNDVWLLWSNPNSAPGEKSLIQLPRDGGMKFSMIGREWVYLYQIPETIARRLTARPHFDNCTPQEMLHWLHDSRSSLATASCFVKAQPVMIGQAA